MKMYKKSIKVARWIWLSSFVFFFVYNTYYGWNQLPINETEKLMDDIFGWAVKVALIIYLVPAAKLYSDAVEKNDI